MKNARPKSGQRQQRSNTATVGSIPLRKRVRPGHGEARRRTGTPGAERQRIAERARAATNRQGKSAKTTQGDPEVTHGRRGWVLLGVIVLVTAVVLALFEASFFEVRSVQVSGNARTNDGLTLDTLAVPEDQALLTHDLGASVEALSELPWVAEVDVARQWPSTLRVVIQEHAVAASIGRPNGSEWLVLAEDGSVIERRLTPPASVPLIIGTDVMVNQAEVGESIRVANRALEIIFDVPLQLDGWITTWALDDSGVLTAELVGSAEANFGAFEDPRTQFVSLASILDGGAELTCLDRIDLSVPDTPVLHRNTACILAAYENR